MKKTSVKIGNNEHLYDGDISVIIGLRFVRVLLFCESGECKQIDIEKLESDIVTINNWKEDK